MVEWKNYSREEIREHATITHRKAHGSRPDVLLIDIDGATAVLKDYTNSDIWFKRLLAPLLVIREVRSLKKLNSISGIPRLFHVYNRHAFLIESINCIPASQFQPGVLDSDFFDRMRAVLAEIHKNGVTHCDLRSAGNTLISEQHEPWLVDFVASIHQSGRWNPVGRWIFSQFVEADYSAVLKLKNRLAPALLTEEEIEQLEHPRSTAELIGRRMGRSVRFVTRNLFPSKK